MKKALLLLMLVGLFLTTQHSLAMQLVNLTKENLERSQIFKESDGLLALGEAAHESSVVAVTDPIQQKYPIGRFFTFKYNKRHKHYKVYFSSKYACPHCPKKFDNTTHIKVHIAAKHYPDIKPFECKNCAKPYCTESALRRHRESLHAQDFARERVVAQAERELKIEAARQSGLSREPLRQDSGQYVCQFCTEIPYETRDSGHMKDHIDAHFKDGRFLCTDCPSIFKTSRGLSSHQNKCHQFSS